jgi:glutaredoxin-like protein NrdH
MTPVPVTLYTTPNCVQCAATARQLDKHGIEFKTVDLSKHPELLEKFKAEGHMSAPIVTTDIKTWSGFRITKIKSLAQYIASEDKSGKV